ncbi:MAG: isoprenylcysteine carboxylmethyltransferase family protein [bacterium]
MKEFLKDKVKYIKEPYRLRVHLGYILIIALAVTAEPIKPLFVTGSVAIGIGIIIRIWASGIVKKDEQLAVEGPYSLCRNPLYVGNILIGYGFGAINGQLWGVILLTAYLLAFYPYTIIRENRKMKRLFGDEFEDYKDEVPTLIPRLTPYSTLGGWSFSQYFWENKDFVNEGLVVLFWGYTTYLYLG